MHTRQDTCVRETERGPCRDMALHVTTWSVGRLDSLGHERVFLCHDGARLTLCCDKVRFRDIVGQGGESLYLERKFLVATGLAWPTVATQKLSHDRVA